MGPDGLASRELNEESETAYESEPSSNRFDMVCANALADVRPQHHHDGRIPARAKRSTAVRHRAGSLHR